MTSPRRFAPVSLGSPRFRTAEAGAFRFTHARFPAGLVLPTHVHERACVATTVSGRWDSVMLGRPSDSRPGTVLVEPTAERHSNHFTVPSEVLVIQPDPDEQDLLRPCARFLGSIQCLRAPGVVPLAQRIAGELTERDELSALVLEGLALELLATAARGTVDMAGFCQAGRSLPASRL